ncbi:hypothetical protein A4X06_0g8260 [Tilletia controversa]|uniref:ACT-like domain-containing protein n=1 Tax=Tilletia controversa TaxID=13291 RepID=A0A8X7STC8_9BASI|nr:hypothetical protein A4X06_0g8260 [Tilletia controversa]
MAGLQSAPSASISSNNSDTATAVPAVGESASALRPPPLAVLSFTPDGTVERRRQTTCVHRRQELQGMLTKLEAAGMPAIDISGERGLQRRMRGTSLAGGSMSSRSVFSDLVQFPERPNALQKFLVTLHETNTKYPRNITLFHYRNYGSDVGKVLAGIAVDLDSSSDPGADGALSEEEKEVEARRDLDRWLTEEQGYPFVEETENVVYRRFLREG